MYEIDPGDEIDVESALWNLALRHAFVELCIMSRETDVRPLRVSVWLVRGGRCLTLQA